MKFKIVNISMFVFVFVFAFNSNVIAAGLEACAKSTENGGQASAIVAVSFPWGNSVDENWQIIASATQGALRNNAAFDAEVGGIHLTFVSSVGGISSPLSPLYVFYSGKKSIEKEILDNRGIDTDKPDPNPCDPNKNEDNGSEDNDGGVGGTGGSSGGGSGSGGVGSGGGSYGGGSSGGGGDPCATGEITCTVIIKQV